MKCVTAAFCLEATQGTGAGKLLALNANEELGSVRARPGDLPTAGARCQGTTLAACPMSTSEPTWQTLLLYCGAHQLI